MSNLISETKQLLGMARVGYVTLMDTIDGPVMYGLFSTREEAHDWAKNLEGAVSITPVYEPSFNRG